MESKATADQHGAGWRVEVPVRERARRRLELAERAVRVQVVHGADEIADPPVGRPGVHGQGAADRGGDSDETLDAAEIEGGRLPDERRERHPGAGDGLLTVELGAPEAALEAQDDPAQPAILHQQIVAAADHRDRQLLALGEHERVANVVHVLWHDEDVGGAADAERGVEAQGLLEPHFPTDLS